MVWVKDASRSVPVAAPRCSATSSAPKLLADVKADYDSLRARHAAKHDRPMVTLSSRRAPTRTPIDWSRLRVPPAPRQGTGRSHVVVEAYDLAELRDYIDWQPFFNAWEMKGKFPDILNNPTTGEAARKLYDDAQEMLDRIIEEKWLTANGVVGFFPASRVGDDIEVYTDETAQRGPRRAAPPAPAGRAPRGRAQPVARPTSSPPRTTGLPDYVGAFAVTAGLGAADRGRARSRKELDDYNAILLESLADRLAEAFAERLHERVRTEFWGYAPDEQLDNEGLIKEKYAASARRPATPPAPTTPRSRRSGSCSTSRRNTGIELTESMAMWPGAVGVRAGTSATRESQYFVVGRLGRDQVADYAAPQGLDARRGGAVALAEPRLRPRGLRCGRTSRCCGTWTARWSTPSPTGSRPSARWPRARRHLEPSEHALQPGRQRPARVRPLHPRAHGDRPRARRRSSSELLDGVIEQVEQRGALAARRRRAARRPARGRRAVRAGDDVLPAVRRRRSSPRCPEGRSASWSPATRSSAASRTPSPTSRPPGCSASTRRTAWRSRTPTPAPGRPRRPAARCCASRTTCRSLDGERRVFADSLVGLERRKPSGPVAADATENRCRIATIRGHPPWTPALACAGMLRAVPTPASGRGPDPRGVLVKRNKTLVACWRRVP